MKKSPKTARIRRMIITWYGQACFRIQSGKVSIVIDPFDKSIGLTPPRGEAHIVLVTHNHKDHNNIKTIGGDPFVVDSPGEYEKSGAKVTGIHSFHDDKQGSDRGMNTMYVITMEDMRIAHLGDIGQDELSDEQKEILGEVDILMVPVGGVYTIDGEKATSITNSIAPKIVIPMHYKIPGLSIKLQDANQFIKEFGYEGKPVEKLTIKKNDLPQDRMEVVVMKI